MNQIWKYKLEIKDKQDLTMPVGAEIISVSTQHGVPHLWAIVDSETDDYKPVKIITIGTGHDFKKEDVGRFIGTYKVSNDAFVFHVFEEKKA